VAQFTTDIRHIKGEKNIVADTLSRSNIESISVEDLVNAQKRDHELSLLQNSTNLKPVTMTPGLQLICETSHAKNRPYVPAELRRAIFEHYHCLSHPAYRGTKRLIAPRYFWPSMAQDIES